MYISTYIIEGVKIEFGEQMLVPFAKDYINNSVAQLTDYGIPVITKEIDDGVMLWNRCGSDSVNCLSF